MPTSPTNSAIEHLRRAVQLRDGTGLGDGELLACFIERRDEAALAALIKRHGQMVWGACRRLLSHHDAEDAFQATFLVLVRKAASIVPREMVGNWLYGVAHQTALQARRTATRRRAREEQVTEMPDTEAVQQDQWPDMQPLLDQELSRLPDNYRAVIVLCDLEGRTRKEVARQLGVPEGTVAGRLARARAMLAKRLTQRGVTLSGGALAAVLSQNVASAGVLTSVVSSTIKAASGYAAGQTAASGVISPKVAALTEGVLKAMMMSKLKAVVAIVLMLGFLVIGGTVLSGRMAAAKGHQPPAAEGGVKTPQKQEKEPFTAWGKEVDGVQIGIQLGEQRVYTVGETVTLIVRIRNNGKKEVPYSNGDFNGGEYFLRNPPLITAADGKPVKIKEMRPFTLIKENSIAPGKEADLTKLSLALRSLTDREKDEEWTLYGTGKFHVQYKDVTVVGEARPDSGGLTLTTGKLELEVKPKTPAAPEKKEPTPQKQEKEAFTVWGKEAGGLQAGLGFRHGEKRAYSHGEAVAVVLRVRNVGKEAVEFKHIWAFFVENPPKITDADGKLVQLPRFAALGLQQPRSTNVAPGKEVELYEWSFDLRPKGESGNKGSITIHGTGKFSLQCERIVGPTSANPNHPNPALDKLATGKLELEIKTAPPKPEKEQEKEAFTAWGKEVDGVQAGLGFRPVEKRAYSQGETVRVVVRVRNVGKEAVEFKHIWAFFVENPPKITDADGKLVQLPNYRTRDKGLHMPRSTNVAPGKEVELYEWTFDLQPKGENSSRSFIHGTGKFSLQCERIVGPTWLNPDDPNPTLSKLATGKLELEINPEKPAATGKK
ncbi:MAG TPA: sigma-70 family RNA polymerase sigma factor [Gemmata sp.]|jgi:RNA polymerase sigma factor (sigma-70 family)|nr:sigma-70 family RNA polymerase sigma factor [Gemmata sp.]